VIQYIKDTKRFQPKTTVIEKTETAEKAEVVEEAERAEKAGETEIKVRDEVGGSLSELQLCGTRFSLEIQRSVFLMNISVEFLLYYHCIYIESVLYLDRTGCHQTIQLLYCVYNHYYIPVIST
jgi:hypothetical protein